MAKAKKSDTITLINKNGDKRTLPKDEVERILAWCIRTDNVGLWKLDESDKKDNE